jgi:hypothetical protein
VAFGHYAGVRHMGFEIDLTSLINTQIKGAS